MLKEVKILFYFFPPLFDVCENELENISSGWHVTAFCELYAQEREGAILCQRCLAHFCYSRSQLEHPHGTDGQSAEILLSVMYFYVMRLRYLTEAGVEAGSCC